MLQDFKGHFQATLVLFFTQLLKSPNGLFLYPFCFSLVPPSLFTQVNHGNQNHITGSGQAMDHLVCVEEGVGWGWGWG
jgi:hypothetical protein